MQSFRAPNAIAIIEPKLQGSNARKIVKSFSVLNGDAPYVESLECEKVVRIELTNKKYSRTKRHCPDCGAPVGYPYRKRSRACTLNGDTIRCRKCNAKAVGKRPKKRTRTVQMARLAHRGHALSKNGKHVCSTSNFESDVKVCISRGFTK